MNGLSLLIALSSLAAESFMERGPDGLYFTIRIEQQQIDPILRADEPQSVYIPIEGQPLRTRAFQVLYGDTNPQSRPERTATTPDDAVKYGWKPESDGGLAFMIQITRERFQSLRSGIPVRGQIPLGIPDADIARIRSVYVFAGVEALPQRLNSLPANRTPADPLADRGGREFNSQPPNPPVSNSSFDNQAPRTQGPSGFSNDYPSNFNTSVPQSPANSLLERSRVGDQPPENWRYSSVSDGRQASAAVSPASGYGSAPVGYTGQQGGLAQSPPPFTGQSSNYQQPDPRYTSAATSQHLANPQLQNVTPRVTQGYPDYQQQYPLNQGTAPIQTAPATDSLARDILAAQIQSNKELADAVRLASATNGTTRPSTSEAQTAISPSSERPAVAVAPTDEPRPWAPLLLTTFALFTSLGANAYLGWLAWSFYWRFRDAASDVVRARNTASSRQAA